MDAGWTLLAGAPGAPLLCACTEQGEAELYRALSRELGFSALLCTTFDWDGDLSPWPAALPGRAGRRFRGAGEKHLEKVCCAVLQAEAEAGLHPRERWIAGYSLSGLFALYACLRSELFTSAATVSGSLWYPGFAGWVRERRTSGKRIYCSLGDLESRTRHPVFRENGALTLDICRTLIQQGNEVSFTWEPGNHFQDPPGRVERALTWLARR